MKFTLHFGNNTFPDLAGTTRLARSAEAAGFDSVIAVDHVVYPDSVCLRIASRCADASASSGERPAATWR